MRSGSRSRTRSSSRPPRPGPPSGSGRDAGRAARRPARRPGAAGSAPSSAPGRSSRCGRRASFCISASSRPDELAPLEADRAAEPRAFRRRPISASAVIVLPEPEFADDAEALALAEAEGHAVDDAAAPFASGRSMARSATSSSMSRPRLESRVERVAQAVAEQVEAEHAERDGEAGIDGEARRDVHPGLRVGQHAPPRGSGGCAPSPR